MPMIQCSAPCSTRKKLTKIVARYGAVYSIASDTYVTPLSFPSEFFSARFRQFAPPVNLVFIFTFRSGLILNFITKHTTTNPWHTTHFHFCTLMMMMMMMMRRFVKRVLNSPQRRCQSIKQYKQSNYQTLCMTEQSRLDHQFNSHESSMNNYRTLKRP